MSEQELRLQTWVQLARCFHLVQRRVVSEVSSYELTLPQFDILATLRFSEGVTQQELAARLLVTKGNVCGVITRLESFGWVERRTDPKDGRANRLHLTAAGRKKIDAVLPLHDALILKITRTLSASQAKVLRGLLQEVTQASEDLA